MSKSVQNTAGKITFSIVIIGFVVFAIAFLFDFEHSRTTKQVVAQELATTTVTVVNTPPLWTVDAQEAPESSTSSPTNVGDNMEWTAIGTDSNNEDYFLLICGTSASPIPVISAPPTCASTQWAVSATTTSGTIATATRNVLPEDSERNEWWAWICDANAGFPQCNSETRQGDDPTDTPWHANHPPQFTLASNDSPADPGQVVTWYSTSTDPDVLGSDTVALWVCQTQAFATTPPSCPGGFIASSSVGVTNDASTSTTIVIPTQDATYPAFLYIIDNHNLDATSTVQGTSSPYTVNNVTPSVAAGSISINGGTDITLSVELGETTGFTLSFVVTDNNSCVANGSTTSEFNSAILDLYKSDVTQAGCDSVGEYNANYCYTSRLSTTTWNVTPATSTGGCSGPTDTTEGYEVTFPLWYIADPTDPSSPDAGLNWLASVQVDDDNFATSTPTEAASGVELLEFLAFEIASTTLSIDYGSLAPGNTTTPLVGTTTIRATGNVGLDEALDGEDMCTTYSGPDTCPVSASSTIPVEQQRFATSQVAYNVASTLTPTSSEFEINVSSTTATATPATGDTFWGIAIPTAIQLAGDYEGQNTFIAITSEASEW